MSDPDARAIEMVLKECEHQRMRWSEEHDDSHTKEHWTTILTVYLGKAAQNTAPYQESNDRPTLIEFRKRLVQLAAVALSAVGRLNEKLGDV